MAVGESAGFEGAAADECATNQYRTRRTEMGPGTGGGEVMTRVLIIEHEPKQICELCGKAAETRPYGPNGEKICFRCGMKNKETTERKFRERITGTTEH